MSHWEPVATLDQIPPGEGLEVTVGDQILAIYHVDGEIYAVDGICPHAGGPLGAGVLRGHIVTCPWHGWQFDVSTGKHCLSPQIHQQRFAVRIEENRVLVELP